MFPYEKITTPRRAFGARCSRYFLSLPALLVLFALAVFFSVSKFYVAGALTFAGILTLALFLASDLTALAAPILFVTVFVCNCYDSFDTFIKFVWVVPIVLAGILYNLIVYREKIRVGRTLIGLIAVSAALLLGGLGTISAENYFSPTSLFYMLGLGVGMVAAYVLIRSRFAATDIYSIFGRVSLVMYLMGLLAVINILMWLKDPFLSGTLATSYPVIPSSNNLSTILMFAMPFPVWYALKQNPLHILSVLVFYAAIVLSTSRAGIVMGAIELLVCLLFWAHFGGKGARRAASLICLICILCASLLVVSYANEHPAFDFVTETEMRSRAIPIAVRSFLDHPIFGVGLKSDVLNEIYHPKKGALCWFHMYVPQIIASMGAVGILAYSLQLLLRASLILRKKCGALRMTLGISYLGVFLMSQLNPGEFCPLPYGLMVVVIFAMLEQLSDTEKLARQLAPEWN